MSLDRYLVEHCAPTLASVKTANLFSCRAESLEGLLEAIGDANERLGGKGVELILLHAESRETGTFGLVYVCRKERLAKDLVKQGVPDFLQRYGYDSLEVNDAIERLRVRLASSDRFPHEIGIFLDYPLGDVQGFIRNGGLNAKCTGVWKVYCDECAAKKKFAQFAKCRAVYSDLWRCGRKTLSQLTVRTQPVNC